MTDKPGKPRDRRHEPPVPPFAATDIALTTNVPAASLEMKQLQPIGDARFATLLVVRSGAFAAALPFSFERASLRVFVQDLQEMRTVGTSAALAAVDRSASIRFEPGPSSRLTVLGELKEGEQRMTFSFSTDQSCLGTLVADLSRCLSAAAGG